MKVFYVNWDCLNCGYEFMTEHERGELVDNGGGGDGYIHCPQCDAYGIRFNGGGQWIKAIGRHPIRGDVEHDTHGPSN